MRSLLTLLLLSFTAMLATPAAAQEDMEGLYVLMNVDGRALPAPSPTEDGVVMHGASLLLSSESRWVMTVTASTRQVSEPAEHWTGGSWSVTGNSITLTPGPNSKGASMQRFRWTMDGTRLKLTDPEGHEYTFQRT